VQYVNMLVQHVSKMLVQHAHDPFNFKGIHLTKDVTKKLLFLEVPLAPLSSR